MPISSADNNDIIFQCYCSCGYLEVSYFDDAPREEDDLISFMFICHPTSLLSLLQSWWKYRKSYFNDIILTREDVQALEEKLKEYLK